jgi:hypothetical protein
MAIKKTHGPMVPLPESGSQMSASNLEIDATRDKILDCEKWHVLTVS